MTIMPIKKSCETFFISLVVLSLAACIDKSEQVVKKVNHTQQLSTTDLTEISYNAPSYFTNLALKDKHDLISKKQLQESQLSDVNTYQPELETVLEEISVLQEKLKNTENHIVDAEKKMLSAITTDNPDSFNEAIWIALIDENLKLHDNLSKYKNDLRILEIKYQNSRQNADFVKTELVQYPLNF